MRRTRREIARKHVPVNRRRVQDEDDIDEDEEMGQATQGTQNGRRRAGGEDDDDDEEDEGVESDGGAGASQAKNATDDDLDRKANDLVRLALFHEQRRTPLKRDEISKKVLGSSSRSFNAVLERTQRILRDVFGMELVELQSRAEREKDADTREDAGAEQGGRKAANGKKKSAPAGSKTYILRSTFDPLIIEYAALTDEQILEEEVAEAPSDDDGDDGSQLRSYGSIISWSASDQLGSIGILYVILALILVNGRVISDNDLRAVLKQFRLTANAPVPLDGKSTNKAMQMNSFLSLLQKQGYLERSVIGDPKSGGKRARGSAGTQGAKNNEDPANVQWKWGGRAHSEVGEKGIAKFIAEFMVERMAENEDEDGDEDEAQGKKKSDDLQQRRLEVMMKGIQRAAAGGELSDVK